MRARHHAFQDIRGTVHSARDREIGVDMIERMATQCSRSSSSRGRLKRQAGHDFQRFDVEIRLVKAIEKDQCRPRRPRPAVCPCWRAR